MESGNSRVIRRYKSDMMFIRLQGPIENESVFQLCDEINLAVDYYHYRKIEIELDSPGGSVDSLEYYLGHLARWRKNRIAVSTLAMTKVASAAAIILSMGDIGKRRAYPSSQILYHDSRIFGSGEIGWTKAQLETQRAQLEETDNRLMTHLIQHVYAKVKEEKIDRMKAVRPDVAEYSGLNIQDILTEIDCGQEAHLTQAQLEAAYHRLNTIERFIPAQVAEQMLLIDSIADEYAYQEQHHGQH